LTASVNPAQFADSVEEYNWAHGLEWGYWKHPPLTTWLMRVIISVVGVSHWTSYFAAAVCNVATLWFMWQLSLLLLPRRAAAFAILLLPLHHSMSWRAQVFNHNTVLVLMSSALVWAVVRATQRGRSSDWALVGLIGGAAMLTKYQAVVPIMAALTALKMSGAMEQSQCRRGIALATLVGMVVFLPHLIWEVSHDWPTLRYVEHSAPVLALPARFVAVLKFFGAQVGLYVAVLFTAALAAFWPSRIRRSPVESAVQPQMVWIWSLVLVPVAIVTAIALFVGLKPPRDWGIQTLQFLPLLLAALLEGRKEPVSLRIPLLASGIVGVGIASFYVYKTTDASEIHKLNSADRVFPARQLAGLVMRDWRQATQCPLRYVEGNGFTAGLVSVYSGAYPQVLEEGDHRKSPWVDTNRMTEDGWVQIEAPISIGQAGPVRVQSLEVPADAKNGGTALVRWKIHPPNRRCKDVQIPGETGSTRSAVEHG